MAIEVVLPRLGWDMQEGSLVEWVKADGDRVEPGDVVCLIEGDKAVVEVESMDAGILRIPPGSPPIGAKVPVGSVIAYLVQPGEPAPFETAGAVPSKLPSPAAGRGDACAQRRTGEGGTSVPAAPAISRSSRRSGPRISPRARRGAAELGVDWTTLTGSGLTGRIRERDIRAAAQIASTIAAEAARPTPNPQPPSPAMSVPFTGVRRLTAQRLSESARTVAPVTLTTEADATELARLREQIKADLAGSGGVVPSYNDLLGRLVAVALTEHPALNASLAGDELVQHASVNLGFAVDTERGLLVVVVRDAQRKSVSEIAAESARLVEAARSGRIAPESLQGGTFTITNLGMYEIDAFTPIVNLPECAILGAGRIVARPVVVDEATERVAVRRLLALSLSFDHRLVDGAPAARFLQRVKQFVEHPTLWLIR